MIIFTGSIQQSKPPNLDKKNQLSELSKLDIKSSKKTNLVNKGPSPSGLLETVFQPMMPFPRPVDNESSEKTNLVNRGPSLSGLLEPVFQPTMPFPWLVNKPVMPLPLLI